MPVAVEYLLYGLIAFAAFMLGFSIMWPLVRFLERRLSKDKEPVVQHESVMQEPQAVVKEECSCKSFLTRHDIVDEARKSGGFDISVVEHPEQLHQPVLLKWHGKTYSMLYGTDLGVIIIIKLANEYAEALRATYPDICRAHFPTESHWYYLPVNGAFPDKESVFEIIHASRDFVASNLAEAEASKTVRKKKTT